MEFNNILHAHSGTQGKESRREEEQEGGREGRREGNGKGSVVIVWTNNAPGTVGESE